MFPMQTPPPNGSRKPAFPITADELVAFIANEITPDLVKIRNASAKAEEAYRKFPLVRAGFTNHDAAKDGVATLLYFLDEAIKCVRKVEQARG
jgi:hypothetical protein